MNTIIKDAMVWVGTFEEFLEIRNFAYKYDIYIGIKNNGKRFLLKSRF